MGKPRPSTMAALMINALFLIFWYAEYDLLGRYASEFIWAGFFLSGVALKALDSTADYRRGVLLAVVITLLTALVHAAFGLAGLARDVWGAGNALMLGITLFPISAVFLCLGVFVVARCRKLFDRIGR